MVSSFLHSFYSKNSTSSRISSYGRRCTFLKGGNFLRYLTILSIQQMKSRILVLRVLYRPHSEVPLLKLKRFWRKEMGGDILHHQLIILIFFVPLSQAFWSNTRSDSPINRFLVIPNCWGRVDRSYPRIILLRMPTKLRRASGLPVCNSGT